MNFTQSNLVFAAAVALFSTQSARADQVSRSLAMPEQMIAEPAPAPVPPPLPAPKDRVVHCDSAPGDSRYALDVILKGQDYHLAIDYIENQNTTRFEKNGRATRSVEDTVVTIQFRKDGAAEEKGSLVLKRNGKMTAEGSLTFTDRASIPLSCRLFDGRVFPHQYDGFLLRNCSRRPANVTKIQLKHSQTRSSEVVFEKGLEIKPGQEVKVPSVYTKLMAVAVFSEHSGRACFSYRGYDNQ